MKPLLFLLLISTLAQAGGMDDYLDHETTSTPAEDQDRGLKEFYGTFFNLLLTSSADNFEARERHVFVALTLLKNPSAQGIFFEQWQDFLNDSPTPEQIKALYRALSHVINAQEGHFDLEVYHQLRTIIVKGIKTLREMDSTVDRVAHLEAQLTVLRAMAYLLYQSLTVAPGEETRREHPLDRPLTGGRDLTMFRFSLTEAFKKFFGLQIRTQDGQVSYPQISDVLKDEKTETIIRETIQKNDFFATSTASNFKINFDEEALLRVRLNRANFGASFMSNVYKIRQTLHEANALSADQKQFYFAEIEAGYFDVSSAAWRSFSRLPR